MLVQRLNYILYLSSKELDLIDPRTNEEFFKYVFDYLEIVPVTSDLGEIVDTICDQYNSGGHRLRNLLVALCIYPWLVVDVNLGTHGVCYFGNGDSNPTFVDCIELARKNHLAVANRKFY